MPGILSDQEKAYCQGLEALQKKDYIRADKWFKECTDLYNGSRGFEIISQATRMLVVINEQKQKQNKIENEIKEITENGKETVLLRQSVEEETC